MHENQISHQIIEAALKVHSHFGPGLLESAYEIALAHQLRKSGYDIKQQVPVSITYEGIKLDQAYRIDLLVNDKVVVELKSVEMLSPVHYAQTLTYLRLSEKKLGLLINFNEKSLRTGIHRIVNNL